jgi:hypothetical protein
MTPCRPIGVALGLLDDILLDNRVVDGGEVLASLLHDIFLNHGIVDRREILGSLSRQCPLR